MAYIEFDNVVKSYGSGDAEVRALDGASFSLSVEFEDGGVIDASGSNCFPRGYSEKTSAIRDFFEKLMEEYGFDPNDLWL